MVELGRLCILHDIKIEYNLSGLRFPIGRPFPNKSVIEQLKREGVKIFIGSDSHSIEYFEDMIPVVKKEYRLLDD